MSDAKDFIIKDCVQFKHDLYKKSWEKSGAKTLDEYVEYVKTTAIKSPLWKNPNQNKSQNKSTS